MAIFNRASKPSGIIGALDIGTSKVSCLIVALEETGPVLLGLGHQRSRGLKSGMIVDADEAERAVRAAVGQAERMAGRSIDRLVLAVSCGRPRAASFSARAEVEGPVVRDGDIGRILAAAEAYLDKSGRAVVHLMRSAWRLDSATGVPDPRGLAGRELAVDLTAVTADDGPVRNLLGVVERSHLIADQLVAAPVASALAVATEEDRRLGVLVVEMGAGLTSFATFADGRLVHADSVPVGGNHITYDLARELVTDIQEAERIKTLYGTLVKAASNDSEVFAYPVAGGDDGVVHEASKGVVRAIVQPRVEGQIDLVIERLRDAGMKDVPLKRVVLTGGASQLVGLEQAWSARLECSARVGRPQPIGRMSAGMCSPAFSTVMGLIGVAAEPLADLGGFEATRRDRGYLDRMHRWIRESF